MVMDHYEHKHDPIYENGKVTDAQQHELLAMWLDSGLDVSFEEFTGSRNQQRLRVLGRSVLAKARPRLA